MSKDQRLEDDVKVSVETGESEVDQVFLKIQFIIFTHQKVRLDWILQSTSLRNTILHLDLLEVLDVVEEELDKVQQNVSLISMVDSLQLSSQ